MMVESRLLKKDLFGEIRVVTCGDDVRLVRDAGVAQPGLRWLARRLLRREARALAALDGLDSESLARIVVAYEPVWAIGTGKNATPADAGTVHAAIHSWFEKRGVVGGTVPVLYGGSVKPENAQELLSEDEIDGVLVGGASLEPESWQAICAVGLD